MIMLLITGQSYADTFWAAMKSQSVSQLTVSHIKTLSEPKEQISCQHLRFRYKELEKILKDVIWLADINAFESPEKMSAHEYIKNRLQANPDAIASRASYQVEVFVTNEQMKLDQASVEAIGILGSTNFELFFPENQTGENSNISKKENGFLFTLQVNAYDICSKSYLDIFILKECPQNTTEKFSCGEGQCPASLTYDWQACGDVTTYRVNLKQLEGKLGLRKREIKWRSK